MDGMDSWPVKAWIGQLPSIGEAICKRGKERGKAFTFGEGKSYFVCKHHLELTEVTVASTLIRCVLTSGSPSHPHRQPSSRPHPPH